MELTDKQYLVNVNGKNWNKNENYLPDMYLQFSTCVLEINMIHFI